VVALPDSSLVSHAALHIRRRIDIMARLTTHVLDTTKGMPAAGVLIELSRIDAAGFRTLIKRVATNADGRTDEPLLAGASLIAGQYELVFAIGDYFRSMKVALPSPAFLDIVPVRFGVADANGHYHVPLLATPWSYSTYRGS
jgi:5-hydroxyisourate hydrolase